MSDGLHLTVFCTDTWLQTLWAAEPDADALFLVSDDSGRGKPPYIRAKGRYHLVIDVLNRGCRDCLQYHPAAHGHQRDRGPWYALSQLGAVFQQCSRGSARRPG